jgi:hypothetical protein
MRALVVLGLTACTLDYPPLASSGASAGGSADATSAGAAGSSAGAGSTASATGSSASGAQGGAGGGSAASSSAAGGAAAGGAGGMPPLDCWGPHAVCCGGVACPTATSECCFTDQTQAAFGTCMPKGDCPGSWVSVTCDDTEDCPGGACCTTWSGSQHLGMLCTTVEECTPPSDLGAAGNYPMCNYPGGSCPPGMTCNSDCCLGQAGWGYCY